MVREDCEWPKDVTGHWGRCGKGDEWLGCDARGVVLGGCQDFSSR